MKTIPSLPLACLTVGLILSSAWAQPPHLAVADGGAGLLGYKYTGVEYGYTHHVESEPKALNRYGFVSHAPLPDLPNLDGAFRYDYTRGSASGLTGHTHHVRAALVRYFTYGTAKPFLDVEVGWAWKKTGIVKDDSFVYQGAVGAELLITPRFALTPFVRFEEAAHFGEQAWNFGAKLGYRLQRNWNSTLTVQLDDAHNIEYALGVQRRY